MGSSDPADTDCVAGLEIISALAFFLYDVIRWHLVEYSEDSTSQLLGALALPYEGAVILCSAAAYAIGAGIGVIFRKLRRSITERG